MSPGSIYTVISGPLDSQTRRHHRVCSRGMKVENVEMRVSARTDLPRKRHALLGSVCGARLRLSCLIWHGITRRFGGGTEIARRQHQICEATATARSQLHTSGRVGGADEITSPAGHASAPSPGPSHGRAEPEGGPRRAVRTAAGRASSPRGVHDGCCGGHLTVPKEQKTQQSPASGRSRSPQPVHL